jgi:hypothetical protein
MKATLVIATLTAGVVMSLSGSLLPNEHAQTPQGQQRRLEDQYGTHRESELEDRKAAARDLAEGIHADELRPAEVRAREDAARAIERGLLRRLP